MLAAEKKLASVKSKKPRRTPSDSYLAIGGFIAVILLVGPLLLAFRNPQAHLDVGTEALAKAGEAFQMAWLAGDLQAAEKFVSPEDQTRLKHWAVPRRAALVAGFGERFVARITAVEVIQQTPDKAVIRVRFVIQGREQQTYQNWRLTGTSWKTSF
ncbi:MAG: hypothetical protein WD872_01770 [Pirellulaceae bacterium]